MTHLPHLAARLVGTPLMVERARLETILSVVGPRIGIDATGLASTFPPSADQGSLIITPNGIAILPIHGTLAKRVGAVEAASGLTSYAAVEEMILDAATDPAVRGILLDIDSPGGEVGGVFDLAATIRDVGMIKPVWALASDAFSAAYLIASAAQRIYLPSTAGVGSVGVIAVHVDETQRDAQEGRRYTTVFAGARKNDFSRHEPLSDDAKTTIQAEVDRLYGMFVATVAANRNLSVEAIRATEAGLFFGPNAVSAGLADQVGTIREALADLSATITPPRTPSSPRTTLSTHPEEVFMDQDTPAAGASVANLDPDALRAEGRQQFQQDAMAIAEMCQLADVPHLASEFIAKGMSVEQTRRELLARRASGPEIHSHVLPGTGTHAQTNNLDANPVVTACRKIAQHHALGGM